MGAELSPALLRSALELSGVIGAPEGERDGRPSPVPDRLGAHHVLRYATAEEAETYRRIMRVLYLEHQAFGLRLRPAQVADRLRERYALTADPDWLDQRLAALDQWGASNASMMPSLASTAAEWRRNRYTYDVTPAGRLTEELLAQLDALGEEIGRLDTARLPSIRDALAKLADELDESPSPTGLSLRSLFERLLAEVEALHGGALAFMRSLGDLMRAVEQVAEDEFERGKGALLEHLQGFKKSRSPALGRAPRAARASRASWLRPPCRADRRRRRVRRSARQVHVDDQRARRSAELSSAGKVCARGSSATTTAALRGGRSTTRLSTRFAPCSRSPSA